MTEPLDWALVPTAALADRRVRRNVATWQRTNTREGRYVTGRADASGLFLEAWSSTDGIQGRTVLATPLDDFPSLATQLRNLRRAQPGPWRAVSIREAMGVPAIFGAVNMIANLTGSMSMKAMRNEVELPPDKRPIIIVRPDPLTIPREFYRSTAYNLASRGEAWWWIAKRDSDDMPLSLQSVPPQEVRVEDDPRDLRYPIITWRDRRIPNDDIRQLVYSREPGELRGVGPLQMCGAAISVAVESQIWAANFFAGGGSSIWVKTNLDLSGSTDDGSEDYNPLIGDADRFLDQWMEKDGNTPRITGDSVEDIKDIGINPQGAQMLEARAHQNIDVATMFNMDAELLNAAVQGSSLTYQNIGGRFDGFVRMCLRPNYLEVIEQTMSDFLTRSTVARFNTDALTMADIKTRWDVYGLAVPVIGQEEAAAMAREGEGLTPGDVENAPVPFSPPQAIPAVSQVRSALPVEVRCSGTYSVIRQGVKRERPCKRRLGLAVAPYEIPCPHCKTVARAA